MAYHFYRLLQRASEIVLIHTTSPDAYGMAKGEPSRFIRQIEHELVPASKGNIILSRPTVRFGDALRPAGLSELSVPKTDSIRRAMREMLTGKGLYPTALNQFVSCSMRFYFGRIVKISEQEDVEESMGAADFGNWLHHTLEALDQDYRMKGLPVTAAIVEQLLKEKYTEVIRGQQADTGHNMLLYHMGQTLMQQFQAEQNMLNPSVVSTEQTFQTVLDVEVDGEIWPVKIAGKIDRIERFEGQIRIVDYKTGKVKLPSVRDLREKLPTNTDDGWEKVRQLWLYKYLVLKNNRHEGLPVTAGFYSFRALKEGLINNPVQFAGPDETPDEYIAESEEILRALIQKMVSDEPFRKTQQLKTCEYCDYKKICGR